MIFSNFQLLKNKVHCIIFILPKWEKPREYLTNWRPVSLLNVTHKIVSACIANRIESVLDFLMHDSQKGFFNGRYIEDTRVIRDVIDIAKDKYM